MALGRPTPARRVKTPALCWHTSSQGQAHGAQAPLPTLGPPAESLRPLRDHSPARLARALPTLLPALGPVPPSQGSRAPVGGGRLLGLGGEAPGGLSRRGPRPSSWSAVVSRVPAVSASRRGRDRPPHRPGNTEPRKGVTPAAVPEAAVTCPRPPAASEGLGRGGVRRVGGRLGAGAGEYVGLRQDGQVHQHLQQAAHGELQGRAVQQEVRRLEGVAARPHEHHLDAAGTRPRLGTRPGSGGHAAGVRGYAAGVRGAAGLRDAAGSGTSRGAGRIHQGSGTPAPGLSHPTHFPELPAEPCVDTPGHLPLSPPPHPHLPLLQPLPISDPASPRSGHRPLCTELRLKSRNQSSSGRTPGHGASGGASAAAAPPRPSRPLRPHCRRSGGRRLGTQSPLQTVTAALLLATQTHSEATALSAGVLSSAHTGNKRIARFHGRFVLEPSTRRHICVYLS